MRVWGGWEVWRVVDVVLVSKMGLIVSGVVFWLFGNWFGCRVVNCGLER